MKITQIDPLKYDLLFERFLNPDRISLPDIDVDFDDDGRGRVLQWVTEKYGAEKVAHIITYGTMATKLAIKDVARVQKLPLPESDRLTRLIPDRLPEKNGKAQKINLKNCIENVKELQEACNSSNELLANTMKYAQMLEGNVRNTGVHACGVIIGRDDITDWVPVSTADDKETGEKMLVTQYEGSVIEDTGLIKMDFLGLKTLSIIKEAVENIRQTRHIDLDIDSIPIDDPKIQCRTDDRNIPVRVRRYAKISEGTASHDVRRPHRHERSLSSGTYGIHTAIHRPQAWERTYRVRYSYHGKISERYLRNYGISRAGHVALPFARQFHTRSIRRIA